MKSMRIIYEPKGRALEYAPLAVNLYRGCSHGCDYPRGWGCESH
jgi:DNA repair photolyase